MKITKDDIQPQPKEIKSFSNTDCFHNFKGYFKSALKELRTARIYTLYGSELEEKLSKIISLMDEIEIEDAD